MLVIWEIWFLCDSDIPIWINQDRLIDKYLGTDGLDDGNLCIVKTIEESIPDCSRGGFVIVSYSSERKSYSKRCIFPNSVKYRY